MMLNLECLKKKELSEFYSNFIQVRPMSILSLGFFKLAVRILHLVSIERFLSNRSTWVFSNLKCN